MPYTDFEKRLLEKRLQSHMDGAPLPLGCTGYWQVILNRDRPLDYHVVIHHDGDPCPVHESGVPRAER